MDEGAKAGVGLVVTGCDAPPFFQTLDAVLDEMPPFVHLGVVGDGRFTILLRGDDSQCATLIQFSAQRVVVERLVGDKGCKIDVLDQRLDANTVVPLTRQQDKARQIAQSINQKDDLRRQPAARTAYGLTLSPPFAPVPCRWTLMIVPSIRAYSKSGSPDSTPKIFSNTPLSAQRRNRFQTEYHFPKYAGRSRQGEPVRPIHKTASRNRRLSSPERPGSPSFPGTSGAIRFHCSSFNTRRITTDLHFSALNPIPTSVGIPCLTPEVNRSHKSECLQTLAFTISISLGLAVRDSF